VSIKKVTVIGGGTMGRQIALNNAIHGLETFLNDNSPDVMENVAKWSLEYLSGRVSKGKLTQEQMDKTLGNFKLERDLTKAVADADLVLEAIVENLDAKLELFKKLNDICSDKTILASNSSTYTPSQLSSVLPERLDKYVNLHYFVPALVMKLLEIVLGPHTSEETLKACQEYSDATGKTFIVVQKEVEGYVVNNLLGGINSIAWFLLENGYASVEDIDKGATHGLGHPMGPFQLMDAAGLDTILAIRKARHEINPEKYPAPAQLLIDKVARGECGVKTGKGFYDYGKK
jgi:3-hydroxybutyryl-CoA dehydrogenase